MNKKISFLKLLLVPILLYLTSCSSSRTKANPFENFKRLRAGMTETDVTNIVGKPHSTDGRQSAGINYTTFTYQGGSPNGFEFRMVKFADSSLYEIEGLITDGGLNTQKLYLYDNKIHKKIFTADHGALPEKQLDIQVELIRLFRLNQYGQIDPQEYRVKSNALKAKLNRLY